MSDEHVLDGLPEGIVLWREELPGETDEDVWLIRHERTGVATQGRSKLHALLMLVDALAAYWEMDEDILGLAEDVFTLDADTEEFLDGRDNTTT